MLTSNWKDMPKVAHEKFLRLRAIEQVALEMLDARSLAALGGLAVTTDNQSEAERLRALFRIAAEKVAGLSQRVCRQAEDGELLGALDIANELNVIAYALGLSGGVEVEMEWSGPIDLEDMT